MQYLAENELLHGHDHQKSRIDSLRKAIAPCLQVQKAQNRLCAYLLALMSQINSTETGLLDDAENSGIWKPGPFNQSKIHTE